MLLEFVPLKIQIKGQANAWCLKIAFLSMYSSVQHYTWLLHDGP